MLKIFQILNQAVILSTLVIMPIDQLVHAYPSQIITIEVEENKYQGLDIILVSEAGDTLEVQTEVRDRQWIAIISNAQLQLPQNASIFLQKNPAPGFSSVTAIPLGQNRIQVQVFSQLGSPIGMVTTQPSGILKFSITLAEGDNINLQGRTGA
jgi:hypothetical protein